MTEVRGDEPVSGLRKLIVAGATLSVAALLMACSGEDRPNRPNVEVIGGADTVSVSADSVAPLGGASSTPSAQAAPGKYAPSSNVDSYFAMGSDLKDIRAALASNPPGYAAAEALYSQGKNQTLANGTVRPLSSMPNDAVHAVFPNGASVYGRPNFIDAIVRDGIAGTGRAAGLPDAARRQVVDKGLLMLLYGKALQEFAAAKTRMDTGGANPGVPVDETFAILAGKASGGSYPDALLALATQLERDFKLEGKLASPLEATLTTALAAAQQNNKPAFDRAYSEGKGYTNAIFYLATLNAAKKLEADTTQAARQEHLAEAWGYWQTLRALVAGASASNASSLETLLSGNGSAAWTRAETTRVFNSLNETPVLTALGIPGPVQVKAP